MKMIISRKVRFNFTASIAALFACSVLTGSYSLCAGEAAAGKLVTPVAVEEETFNNWVAFGLGGVIYQGNAAAGQQRLQQTDGGPFGGITDMHLERNLPNKWVATLDWHAIFNSNDFNLKLNVEKPDVGYFRAGFTEFRTWYNGAGGFYPNVALPGDGVSFAPGNDEPAIDRGDVWFELGLRMPNLPEVTFRYDHIWRYGQKDSTEWADTNLTGSNLVTDFNRKIVPAFRDINEVRDVFALDLKKTFGITDLGVGARAEFTRNNDSLNTVFLPGERDASFKDVKLDRYLTQTDTLKSDLFSTHATTETRFNDKVWLTTGYSYMTLNSDIGGDRIFGPHYNSSYMPLFGVTKTKDAIFPKLPLAATASGYDPETDNGRGYTNLVGGSEMEQNEFNVNLLWMPIPDLSILTGFRFDKEDTSAVSAYKETNVNQGAMAYYSVNGTTNSITYLQPTQEPWISSSKHTLQRLAQNLEVRYTGLKDWVLYARCDLDEDNENVDEVQNEAMLIQQFIIDPNNPLPTLLPTNLKVGKIESINAADSFYDTRRLTQKWTGGFNWYPMQRLSFSGQYYHKEDGFDFNSPLNDGYIYSQNFSTDDVNFRVTARPFSNLSMVSRYDFQRMQSFTSAENIPIGDGNNRLGPETSATTTSHMFSECITWNPLDRLYVQGNFTYTISKTNTPASITIQNPTFYPVDPETGRPVIDPATGRPFAPYIPGNPLSGPVNLSFKNNYWQAGLGVGFAVDAKTDLHLDYTYYRANDYGNNGLFGSNVVISQPYGAGQEEQTVSASIERQLCRNTRLTLKYSFASGRDQTTYGGNNFTAQTIFAELLVRF